MLHFFTTRILACLAMVLAMVPALVSASPFTPGNLVVVRIGDGTAALTSAATATYLLEYTPAGVLVQTIALPTTAAGANSTLTNTGSSSTDALLTRSADGTFLVLTGYDAAVGTLALSATTSAANNRVVGRIAANGNFDTSTRLADGFSGGNIRSAASVDGSAFWAVGSTGGVRYAPFGNPAASSTIVVAAVPSNNRGVGIYGGNLYVSSSTGTGGNFYGISQVGTGLPTTASQTTTPLAGFPVTSGPSPYGFFFADLSSTVAGVDVIYVTDDRTTVDGGIQKWSLVGGTWTLNGTITGATATTAGAAIRGLGGQVSGTTVSLVGSSSSGIYLITDNAGYNAAPSSTVLPAAIATSVTNTAFRGIAFAPVAAVATPAPTITSFSPTSGAAGATVTITGTNFTGATAVTLNGVTITGFTVVSATSITFVVPASASSGTITVTTAGGTATSTGSFTFIPASSGPTVTSLAPNTVVAGAGTFTLTVNGTGFTGTSVVNFGTTPLVTTAVSATQLTATVPAGTAAGTYAITVTNPGTGGGTSNAVNFVVTPAPTLTSLSPNTAAAGSASFVLTATGTNFSTSSVITFNAVALTTTFVSATTLTATVPASAIATAGTVPVTITTSAPGGTASAAVNFIISAPVAAPTVTSFSPARAITGVGFTLTVSGTNLVAGTTINFNGNSYTGAVVGTSGTSYTVVIPASGVPAPGSYNITATNSGGTSAPLSFLVVAAATVTTFEDFEQGTKGSYSAGTVTLRSGDWTFTDALLGNLFNDRVNQVQAARIRGGSIAMNFDKPNGAGVITLNAAIYGTDATASFTLEVSTNAGTSYSLIPGAPTALTTTLSPYRFTVNQGGNIRLRISNTNTTSGANPRINIDDITITNYTGTATLAANALPGLAVFPNPATDRVTLSLPTSAPATVALRDLSGRVVLAPVVLGSDRVLRLPASLASGLYLLEVQQHGVTAVRRIEKN